MKEEKDKIDLGISKILNSDFPAHIAEEKTTTRSKPFEVKSIKVQKNIETKIDSDLEKLYKKKSWDELLNKTQEILDSNSDDISVRAYWVSASLFLNKIPANILVGTLNGAVFEKEIDNPTDKEVVARTYQNLITKLKGKPELKLSAFENSYRLSPDRIRSSFHQFIKMDLDRLYLKSEDLPLGDEVFDQIKYLEELARKYKLEFRKEEKMKLVENQVSLKRSRIKKLSLILIVCLALFLYFKEQIISINNEKPISLVTKVDKSNIPVLNVKIEYPEPKFKVLDSSIDFDDLIKRAQEDPIKNKVIEPKSVSTKENIVPSKKDISIDLDRKIDVTGPKEPPYLRDILDGKVKTDKNKINESKNTRSPFIVKGERDGDDIVSGQEMAGPKKTRQARPGEELQIIEDGSLYIKPAEYEAELQRVLKGDYVLLLRSYGNWYQIKTRQKRTGYIKKSIAK